MVCSIHNAGVSPRRTLQPPGGGGGGGACCWGKAPAVHVGLGALTSSKMGLEWTACMPSIQQ